MQRCKQHMKISKTTRKKKWAGGGKHENFLHKNTKTPVLKTQLKIIGILKGYPFRYDSYVIGVPCFMSDRDNHRFVKLG